VRRGTPSSRMDAVRLAVGPKMAPMLVLATVDAAAVAR
jgi:hypothetical protein